MAWTSHVLEFLKEEEKRLGSSIRKQGRHTYLSYGIWGRGVRNNNNKNLPSRRLLGKQCHPMVVTFQLGFINKWREQSAWAENVEVSVTMRLWVPRTTEEKVEPRRWVNHFWSATCLSSYLCFLLQYTKRLSKRKNTRSWMFPEEIFSKTPHISISVQVSVMLEP